MTSEADAIRAKQQRTRIEGPTAIVEALHDRLPLRLILISEGSRLAHLDALRMLADRAGTDVQDASEMDLGRLSGPGDHGGAIAFLGPDPAVGLLELAGRPGALWLLAGTAYPGNAGFAIRTAEVSGAAGIVIDAAFDRSQRRDAARASLRADRFFPVLFESAAAAIEAARQAGRRIVGIEDSGKVAPWEVDLTGPVLLIVGGEAAGVSDTLLADCDEILRIPTRGVVPSYNLQAAMAVVAGERLRQETRAKP